MDIKKRERFLKRELDNTIWHMSRLTRREHIDKLLDWKVVIVEKELQEDQESLYIFDNEKKIHTILIDSNIVSYQMEKKLKLFNWILKELTHAFLIESCAILSEKDSWLREDVKKDTSLVYLSMVEYFLNEVDMFKLFFGEYNIEEEKQKEKMTQIVLKLKRCSREITNKKN